MQHSDGLPEKAYSSPKQVQKLTHTKLLLFINNKSANWPLTTLYKKQQKYNKTQ